jgi:site-specific recombinase XerD
MLTVRIKNRATIGNLQGPFEASLSNRGTWVEYAYHLNKIVKFLGPDKSPDDVFKQDVVFLREHLIDKHGYTEKRADRAVSVGSSYWGWMIDFGFATVNPFYRMRGPKRAERDVQVLIT